MPWIIDKERRYFYSQNNYLHLEEFFTPEQCSALLKKLPHGSPELEAFFYPILPQDLVVVKKLREVVSFLYELLGVTSLRLGSFFTTKYSPSQPIIPSPALRACELLSVQPVLALALVRLEGHSEKMELKRAGDLMVCSPDYLTNWNEMWNEPHGRFLVWAFTDGHARYVPNPNDPFQHALKKRGYAFGDALRHPLHPLFII